MSRLLTAVLMIGSLAGSSAFAQYGPSTYDRAPRRDRALFDRTRMDLDRAASYPYSSRADRKRFDEARRELFDFSSRFDQGRYERKELDQAINRLQKVVDMNSLDGRDRAALAEDVRMMRDFRNYHSQRY